MIEMIDTTIVLVVNSRSAYHPYDKDESDDSHSFTISCKLPFALVPGMRIEVDLRDSTDDDPHVDEDEIVLIWCGDAVIDHVGVRVVDNKHGETRSPAVSAVASITHDLTDSDFDYLKRSGWESIIFG